MTPLPKDVRTEALLGESDWLRALACHLVSDAQQSEDAVQDTLLTALGRPDANPPSRGWLAAVLRNGVRQRHRSDVRRADREVLSHAGALAPSSSEVAERLELQRLLLEAVQELEEPSRTAIVLRYLDGLPPREVARRMGVSVKTVHGRIDRGVERLRGRLDHRAAGGREAWLRVLMPLAIPARGLSTSLGVVWMSANLKWTVAAVALLVAGTVILGGSFLAGDGAAEDVPAVAPAESERPATARSGDVASPPAADARQTADPSPAVETIEPKSVSPGGVTLSGRVVDGERRGVLGLVVSFAHTSRPNAPPRVDDPPVVSAADGSFEIPIPTERGRLTASGPGWATLIGLNVHGTRPPELPLVVVGPTRSYGGTAVDQDAEPLPAVQVEVYVPLGGLFAEVRGIFGKTDIVGRARTDEQGRFELEGVPWAHGVTLTAHREGYRMARTELPQDSDLALRLELERLAGTGVLTGVVLDREGVPAQGAYVSFSGRVANTGPDGRFAIELAEGDERDGTLLAARLGCLPARQAVSEEEILRGEPFTLRLGGEALAIDGRVLDGDDQPLAGAQVWTTDSEYLGSVRHGQGNLHWYLDATLEDVLSGQVGGGRRARETTTDAAGRFQLRGLLDRPYTLFAMHAVTQEVVRLEHVAAGRADVVFRLVGAEPSRTVAGHVTTLDGEPLAGALLRVIRSIRFPGTAEHSRFAREESNAVTDDQGRFRFEALCLQGTRLVLDGEVVPAPQERQLDQEPDLLDVRFEVPVICWLRVTLTSDPQLADRLELWDDEGERVILRADDGSMTFSSIGMVFIEGRSGLMQANQTATTLVLFKQGVEVDRIPLRWKAGEVHEIDL